MRPQLPLFDDTAMALRLFIGLLPDPDVQRAIDRQRRRWGWPAGTRFPPTHRLHLTLHFLGQVHAGRLAALDERLAQVPMPEMELVLRKPECWHVAVLRADEHPQLRELHDHLARELVQLGLPAGDAWTPHVTLARNIGRAAPPASAEAIHWKVRRFALVWSRLAPTPRHDVLARYGIH